LADFSLHLGDFLGIGGFLKRGQANFPRQILTVSQFKLPVLSSMFKVQRSMLKVLYTSFEGKNQGEEKMEVKKRRR